ncbi:iron ABC transporter permease [Terrarubrum flagellatum]|uniref:FecCD family ABC transporter permease n=1 Tax=Terrirubrum flagellatum TaxID=2895980 RepID=UPI003144EEA4
MTTAVGQMADVDADDVFAARQKRIWRLTIALCAILIVAAIVSLGSGALAIAPRRVIEVISGALSGDAAIASSRDALVILNIRLPRLLLGALVGAGLAVAGTLMQGLFRNPLADPGLVGVSAGAALAAGVTIVFGDRYLAPVIGAPPFALLPVGAFVGALIATMTLYAIATREGRTSIATMLLAGIAIGALAASCMGLLAYVSDDRQLRDLTFWTLGSLGGATWAKVAGVAPIVIGALCATPFLARGLNALLLGEAEAFHLGIAVQTVKRATIIVTALAVGASVAATGIVSFVGIVTPHALRLVIGPDHRALLPLSAILGAALIIVADSLARTIVAPAELPIGILTAIIGAPFFLWMLLRRDRAIDG